MPKLSIRDLNVDGKTVLMRADFNVPLNSAGEITDDTRIVAALPTIQHLLSGGAKLTLCSHLGRPAGEPDPKASLKPVALRLSELLEQEVVFAEGAVGDATTEARAALKQGDVLLLENTRFHAEEKANDADFAKALVGCAEIFVNDAFGTAHRAHASTEGVTHHVSQSAMGLLVEKELEFLQSKLESPERPFLAIMGGAKVGDKIQVINAIMEKADIIMIGGGMAYTFRKAQGYKIGNSLCEDKYLDLALEIMKNAEEKGVKFLLPANTRVTQEFSDTAPTKVTVPYADGGGIEDGWEGIDIGDIAITEYVEVIKGAKTILWNGPMGVFEKDNFAAGTKAVTAAIAEGDGMSIVGGGDSVTAVNKFGNADDFGFMSTGGGASLELLEGKELPGVAALTNV